METEFFKTDDGIYHKIESDYDRDPLHPRKDFDNIGKMVFKKQSRYSLGDIQTDEFAEFFEDELKEIDSDICLEGCITEKQLFDLCLNSYLADLEPSKYHTLTNLYLLFQPLYKVCNHKIQKIIILQNLKLRVNVLNGLKTT